jgi:hypothetical protein
MQTIPFNVILENREFKRAKNPVQLAIIKTVCQLCDRDLFDSDYSQAVRMYGETNDNIFYRNKALILQILHEVMGEIARVKNVNRKVTNAMTAARLKKIAVRKAERGEKQAFSDENSTSAKITPVFLPQEKWHLGQSDQVAIDNAKKPKDKTWMKD